MNRILTEGLLKKFGPGDQLQVFFPAEGFRIVGEIKQIGLNIGGTELLVTFKQSFILTDDGNCTKSSISCYEGAPLSNLSVLQKGDGFANISNTPAEQILIFVKPNKAGFITISSN